MKKVIALLLTFMLLLGCGVTAAHAESSKLLPDLQRAMAEKAPDDVIGVYISYNVPVVTAADMPSWPDIGAARKEYFAYADQKQAEIQAEIFDGIDVEIGFQGVHSMVLAHVKVSDIEKIASYDIVRDMDYYDDTIQDIEADDPAEPEHIDYTKKLWESGALPTAEDIEEAANEQRNTRNYIFAKDITVYDAFRFDCVPAYLVDYEFKGYGVYTTVIVEELFGDYLYWCSCGYEPSIFVDNQLYTLSKANEAGLLTQEMLRELVDAGYKGYLFGYPVCTVLRNVKGDADGDGEVSVIDATYVQRHEANITTGTFYKSLADADGDGDISVIDATVIQRSEAGLYQL